MERAGEFTALLLPSVASRQVRLREGKNQEIRDRSFGKPGTILKTASFERVGRIAAGRGQERGSQERSALVCFDCFSRLPCPQIVTKVQLPNMYLRNLDNPRRGPTLEQGPPRRVPAPVPGRRG